MGGGGKGGGGSGKTPTEWPDSLKSTQRVQIVDLVTEGPILGPVDGLKSVYLDDTPVQGDSGKYNFSGVDVAWRNGSPVQDVLPGLSSLESQIPVSVQVKNGSPVVRVINNEQIDRIRLIVGGPRFQQVASSGNIIDTRAVLHVDVLQGATWVEVEKVDIKGKSTVAYTRSVEVFKPNTGSWSVRVRRSSPDGTSAKTENDTFWYSYTEIIDAKLTFPHSAVVGLRFDAEQFSSIPRRNYLIKGRIVRVPTNYDAETRTYTGIWDGGWQLSWTDNPAWIFYDLVTHTRYGLGRYLSMMAVEPDKWALYQIAQYCDQLVDDGYGGTEPRMTCNLYLTETRQAYDVLTDLASVFRGMPVWDGLQMGVSQDIPHDPVAQFNNANVIDGKFSYQSSARKARHTAVRVEFINPDTGWEKDEVYVQDDAAVARYGLNVKKVQAFSCTSRGQAYRTGKWLLTTEQLERQSLTFNTGQQGLVALPGDIIETVDNAYAGARHGGRVRAVDGNIVTLDAPITLTADQQNWLHYLDNLNQVRRLQIISPAQGETDTLVLADDPVGLLPLDVFHIATAGLTPRLWRVMAISEDREAGTYVYQCLQHVPEKHDIIEQGLQFEPRPASLNGGKLPPVEHLQVEFLADANPPQVRLTWSTPRVMEGIQYEVKVYIDERVALRRIVSDTEYIITQIAEGSYRAELRAVNRQGQKGPEADLAFEVSAPAAPFSLSFTPSNFGINVVPVSGGPTYLGTSYEFYGGSTEAEVLAQTHYLGRGYMLEQQGLTPNTQYWYGVLAVNALGRSTMTVGSSTTLMDPSHIVQLIEPEIPKLQWAKDLELLVGENTSDLVLLNDRAALVVNAEGRISGITVTAGSEASAIDFLADYVSFTDPDTLERNLYWDNQKKKLVVRGHLEGESGDFAGTVYADKIEGDVVRLGFFQFDAINHGEQGTGGGAPNVWKTLFTFSLGADSKPRMLVIDDIPVSYNNSTFEVELWVADGATPGQGYLYAGGAVGASGTATIRAACTVPADATSVQFRLKRTYDAGTNVLYFGDNGGQLRTWLFRLEQGMAITKNY